MKWLTALLLAVALGDLAAATWMLQIGHPGLAVAILATGCLCGLVAWYTNEVRKELAR